ncbi:gypsy type transposase [Tanacetum coccineum]
MESMRMNLLVACIVMLMAVSAVSNVAAQEAPAPAPTSDAATFVPTAVASIVAFAFGLEVVSGTFVGQGSAVIVSWDADSLPRMLVDPRRAYRSEMDLFAFIRHADPTKVKIGEREVREGEVPLFELTRGRVIPLARVNDQEGVVAQGVGNDNVNEGSDGFATADQTEQSGPIVHIRGIDIEADAEAQALVADKPKKFRKRKTADGAGNSGHPPKRLREDHGTSGDAGASTGGKSLAALQDLLDKRTLSAEIGVTTAATVPFVTSYVTLTPEHEGDDEVSSVVRSIVSDLAVLTTAIATTVIAGTSVPQPKEVNEPTRASIFADSTSTGNVGPDVARPSQLAGNDISFESFYVSLDMDSKTLHLTYVPKWDVLNESVLDDSNACHSLVDQLAPPGEKWLEGKCGMQANLLKERDTEIACLKAQLSLKEAKTAEVIHLRSRIADIEATDATRTGELESLKEWNAALESAALSCDDLSIKASTLESEKDKLFGQVSELEATCFGLRDEVAGYKLFKEQVEAMQDDQVQALSDSVADIDFDLMNLAWILSRGLKLVVMKCLQSPRYLAALGGALGRAIDKGMHDGLKAGVDHGRSERGLDVIDAYDPSAEANFVSAVEALRAINFPLLTQLESRKDASMADIFDLLHLEGPTAEIPEASQLQPSFEQLMVPIHRLEDQVVIGEASLSFALDVAHYRVQRLKGDDAACRLSLTVSMVPLLEPLSVKSLTGEASTSMVPSATVTTTLSTTFVQANTIPLFPSVEVPPSLKIMFEEEELNTTSEHTSAP